MPNPTSNILATSSAQNSSSENSILCSIDDAVLAADKKVTALDRLDKERAKVQVLTRQLDKLLEEKKQVQNELLRTRAQLENQMKQNLQIRKKMQATKEAHQEQQALGIDQKDKDIEDLRNELKLTQADLLKEISQSGKLQKYIQQCAEYEKELLDLKHMKGKEDANTLAVKQLERQRDELLVVVKKQMKLMDILKQQALHARAAAILEVTEKEFVKELSK